MPAVVVLGTQWGDEGKGKATDQLGSRIDYVVKFNGGNNAGHTVVIGGEKYALHLLPSGILSPGVVPVIGNGVVVDLEVLFQEIDALEARRLSAERLLVSSAAHVIAPYHRTIDKVTERFLGKRKIGTTGRGIGPAYEDKVARRGIRVADLHYPDELAEKLRVALDYHNFVLTQYLKVDAIDFQKTLDEALAFGEYVEPMKADVAGILHDLRKQGRKVLFEGAQGSLLDIDHGTYPYVTSSNTTVGGAYAGTGVGAGDIDYVLGIAKAYATRVGGGPFPTELNDDVGQGIRDRGQEYGATTGRPRRCGWMDIVALKRAVAINGISGLCITKLDILDGMDTLKMCVAYEYRGKRTEYAPLDAAGWENVTPVYLEFPGWQESTAGITEWDKLPPAARAYLRALEELAGCPLAIVSTGPDRDANIILQDPFA